MPKIDPPNIPLPQISLVNDGLVAHVQVNNKTVSRCFIEDINHEVLVNILQKIQWEMEELAKKSSAKEHTHKLTNISKK